MIWGEPLQCRTIVSERISWFDNSDNPKKGKQASKSLIEKVFLYEVICKIIIYKVNLKKI